MTPFIAVIAISLVVALSFAAFYAWHLWRIWLERRRHTRERFLFVAFRLIFAAFIAYLGYLFAGAWTFQLLVSLASGTGINLSVNQNPSDPVLVLGFTTVLLALLVFTYFAFRNWDGPPSEFERRNPERDTTIELILATLATTDRAQHRLMLQPGQEPPSPSLAAPPPAAPGYLRAMSLIMAHDPQYQVRAEDWHPEEHAFIGSYGSEAQPFVFFYNEHVDSDSARFIRDHVSRNYTRHRKRVIAESVDPIAKAELPSDLGVLTFNEILDDPVWLRSYERALQERLTRRRFGADAPSIAEMLVPITAGTSPANADIGNLLNYVMNWVESGSYNRHLALLGEYGQGKSIFATTFALELLRRFDELKRVPILIELGGKSPRTTPIQALLNDWAGAYAVGSSRAQAWLEAGRAVLIFDAFDEMDLVGDRTLRLQNFLNLWQGTWYSGTRIIITGRPNLFLDTGEMREALRLAPEGSIEHHAQPVYLQKLDRGQIESVLFPWPVSVRQGILAAYDQGHGLGTFRELIERPSTLALAASVWPSIADDAEAGRVGNSAIIRQFLYATYGRQREKREREEAKPLLTTPELAFFMRAAAVFMAERHGATNRIARNELADLVGRLLENWPISIAKLGSLPSEHQPDREGKDLAEWIAGSRHRAEAVQLEVAATGMLVNDPTDQAFLRMAHKSFFEYLVAEVLVVKKFPERFAALAELTAYDSVGHSVIERPLSREVLVFAADIIHNNGLTPEFKVAPNLLGSIFLKLPLFKIHGVLTSCVWATALALCVFATFGAIFIMMSYILGYGLQAAGAGRLFSVLDRFEYGRLTYWGVLVFSMGTPWLAGFLFKRAPFLSSMGKLRIILALLYEQSLDKISREIHPDILAHELLDDFAGAEVRGRRVFANATGSSWLGRLSPSVIQARMWNVIREFHYFDTDVSTDVANLHLARINGRKVEIVGRCSGRGEAALQTSRDETLRPYVIYD